MAKGRLGDKKATSGNQLSVGDIGKIAGVPSNTVSHWIARDKSFPKPVDTTTAAKLYPRGSVMRWLKSTGRTKGK